MQNVKVQIITFFFTFLSLYPIYIGLFIFRNLNKIEDEKFMARYGAAYRGLKAKPFQLMFRPIFLARRSLFVIILIYFRS
jgi:hypothetical protein